jgi:hypothetical protein
MMHHLKYLKSVLRHKWYVFLACLQFRVPIWIAILHDWDKFLPDEWIPYANYFYGEKVRRGVNGTYTRQAGEDAGFDFAWLLHQKRNKHHWQWWILPKDDGTTQLFPMSDLYRREMLADWFGAGRAYVKDWTPLEPMKWYQANKDKMQLHPETRAWVESELERREADYRNYERMRTILGM